MNLLVYRASRFAARAVLVLWNRLRATGRENVPADGGVLLVANHASYLDPPVVGTLLRRPVHFLARSTLGKFAPVRWFLSALGVVFVDRDGSPREGLAGAIAALQSGKVVCIFPEGTRSATGALQDFKRGAMLVLKRADVAVVPVGIDGTFRALPRGAFWLRPARIAVRYGAPMTSAEVLAPGGIDELHRRVRALTGQSPTVPAGAESTGAGPAGAVRTAAAPAAETGGGPCGPSCSTDPSPKSVSLRSATAGAQRGASM